MISNQSAQLNERLPMADLPPPRNSVTEFLWYLLVLPPLLVLAKDKIGNGWKKFWAWKHQDRIATRELTAKIGSLADSVYALADSVSKSQAHLEKEMSAIKRRLRENAARMRSVSDCIPLARFECDMETGKCIEANPALCALFNLPREEMLGFGWCQRIHPDDNERVLQKWRRAAADTAGIYLDRYRIRPDGVHSMWIEATGRVVSCDDGHPVLFLGTVQKVEDYIGTLPTT